MQYQLKNPGRRCRDCRDQYEAQERRDYPCQACPNVRFPPLDELSELTLEVHKLAISLSTGMSAPPLDFVMKVLNIHVPSTRAREVVERLALLWDLQRTHAQGHEQKGRQATNGHQTR